MSAWIHRQTSYAHFGDDAVQQRSWRWHILDNEGSYKGWFDWVPRKLRVGPWSPAAPLFLVAIFGAMYVYKPETNLPIKAPPVFTAWWWVNVATCVWSLVLVAYATTDKNLSIWPFVISYTGWSWSILGLRAGCSALGALVGSTWLGIFAEALRYPACDITYYDIT